MNGIVSSTLNRLTEEPQGSIGNWFAFLVVVILLSFLWSKVVKNLGQV